MKNKILILFLASVFSLTTVFGQSITADAWRHDLKWLQHTIHAKYPNLFYNVTAGQFDSAVTAIEKKDQYTQ